MGLTASKPYIFDEFESDDDDADDGIYESAPESITVGALLNTGDQIGVPSSAQQYLVEDDEEEKHLEISSSPNTLKTLHELLKLMERHNFDEIQKVACLLNTNHTISHTSYTHGDDEDVSAPESAETSSSATSSWPSKTNEDITDKLSCILQEQNCSAADLNDDEQRIALAQLDEELIQFEANEEKISHETPVLHSGIPRLKSGLFRSRSAGFSTDSSKKSPVERKRSPSPRGSRPSGIPRYSWAHVSPVSPGTSFGEAKTDMQTHDASSLSNTLESLPELSDKRQTSTNNKTNSSSEYTGSFNRNRCICKKETPGEPSMWDINVSDLTGRVKMRKKHTGLHSLWTKADGPQGMVRNSHQNESHQGVSSSASSEVGIADVVACRATSECGGLSERKVLDLRRWNCISRPQYKTSCGISAVVSCWNYLFSTMGHGSLSHITQETAMKLLGFSSPFDCINFGPHTGNQSVLRWFSELNTHFNVNGRCFIMYKPSGKNQTHNMTDQMALDSLKKGLKDPSTAFIYHCHNHYLCPIGYEDSSQSCVDAYKSETGGNADSWVLFGDTGRKHSPILCQSWEKISLDLNCKSPSYFNIRQSWKGVMQQKDITKRGENLHCIMTFQKVSEHPPASPSSVSSSTSTTSSLSAANSSRLPFRPYSSSTSPARSSLGIRPAVDTLRPELANHFPAKLEEEEVGYENLESDSSEDGVNEIESTIVYAEDKEKKEDTVVYAEEEKEEESATVNGEEKERIEESAVVNGEAEKEKEDRSTFVYTEEEKEDRSTFVYTEEEKKKEESAIEESES